MGFQVWLGAPLGTHELSPDVPILVLEAEPARLEAFDHALVDRWHWKYLECRCEVSGARDGKHIIWYKYNDSRFNGPWSHSELDGSFVNLSCVEQEERQLATLAKILPDWIASIELPHPTNGLLRIRQADPLEALKGTGGWIYHFENIVLDASVIPAAIKFRLQTWLTSNAFVMVANQSEDGQQSWCRDPEKTLLLQHRYHDQLEEYASEDIRLKDKIASLDRDLRKAEMALVESTIRNGLLEDNYNKLIEESNSLRSRIGSGVSHLDAMLLELEA